MPLRTKRPAKCSIPFTFCSAQMMVNVYRSNGQLHGIFLLQQQTQQTDTVCSTGQGNPYTQSPGCTIWCRFIQSAIRRTPSLRRMVVSIWIGEPRKLSIPNQLNGTGSSVSVLRNNAL